MNLSLQDIWESWTEDLVLVTFAFSLIAVPVAMLLFHVHAQFRVLDLGYDIAHVTREHKQLTEENKKLRIEAAIQGRMGRLTQTAQERYGLVPAKAEQIFIVEIDDANQEHAALDLDR